MTDRRRRAGVRGVRLNQIEREKRERRSQFRLEEYDKASLTPNRSTL